MDYMVVYTSKTGNTEKVAAEIFGVLPGGSKDIQRVEEVRGEADTYFVGFWNDKGTCSSNIMDFLSTLHGKKVALFGTCGFGCSDAYYDTVYRRFADHLKSTNQIIGHYICQGKMPETVLHRYEAMKAANPDCSRWDECIDNYRNALSHPNADDMQSLFEAVDAALETIKAKT